MFNVSMTPSVFFFLGFLYLNRKCDAYGTSGVYLIIEIRPVKWCCKCDWILNTQDLLAVFQNAAGCRGSQSDQWDFRELTFKNAQELVI